MSRRRIIAVLGAVIAAVGLVWIAQGLGYLRWPVSSVMIAQRPWADRGAVLAALGFLMILIARRMR